ncbi:MAG: FAD-binding oxidoreductase [Fidelibacterota bacterium]
MFAMIGLPYMILHEPAMSPTSSLLNDLRNVLSPDRVITDPTELIVYECDGLVLNRRQPDAVVLPETTQEVAEVVSLCVRNDIPFLARGAGTGLSGGAVAADGGIIIQMSRMNRILEIDYEDEIAVVQPGVVNLDLSLVTSRHGFHFAPDPASQKACTIGGNVAENAGGPHTLKYGVTVNHVLGVQGVMPNGEIIEIGGRIPDPAGYDLTGLLVGSEGTLGVVTEITVKLTRNPEAIETFLAVFPSMEDACNSVTDIVGAGIIPAALELIDNLVIQAVESHLRVGFPTDAAAVLLIEIDGIPWNLDQQANRIKQVCLENHAVNVDQARSEEDRELLWRGRKEAVGALGKITPAFYTNDGVVPRSRLPEILQADMEIGRKHNLRIAHVCHAGDGNIHPIILYNPLEKKEVDEAVKSSEEILAKCVEMGGAITGEHGIGMEKLSSFNIMFSPEDRDQMARVRKALNSRHLLNPGKIFPGGSGCGEVKIKKAIAGGSWL